MNKITARIYKNGKELWLFINGKPDKTAWAIEEEEVEAIRDACNKYLREAFYRTLPPQPKNRRIEKLHWEFTELSSHKYKRDCWLADKIDELIDAHNKEVE